MVKIFIAADHAGFSLKEELMKSLSSYEFVDMGTYNQERVDYPDYVQGVADNLDKGVGILICGSGIGMSMAANRLKGARAALCHEPVSAALARAHNDANILVLGARLVGIDMAKACVEAFLSVSFEGGRHKNRIDKIEYLLGSIKHAKPKA